MMTCTRKRRRRGKWPRDRKRVQRWGLRLPEEKRVTTFYMHSLRIQQRRAAAEPTTETEPVILKTACTQNAAPRFLTVNATPSPVCVAFRRALRCLYDEFAGRASSTVSWKRDSTPCVDNSDRRVYDEGVVQRVFFVFLGPRTRVTTLLRHKRVACCSPRIRCILLCIAP